MAKYRKTALVEADQFFPEQKPWPRGVKLAYHYQDGKTPVGWGIQTLEGFLTCNPGDYVCTGIKGEQWAVARKIFEATHELVEREEK